MSENGNGCRVLLLTPPRGLWRGRVEKPLLWTQPLGLAYVAAAVRERGHTVAILDAYSLGIPRRELRRHLEEFRPRVVGVSALTPQWPDAEALLGLVKELDHGVVTVAGGPHVSALPRETVAKPCVDVVVVGEGEAVMADLCDAVAGGSSLEEIPGTFVGRGGEVTAAPPREKNQQLDSVPFPAHDLLPHPSSYNPFPSWGTGGTFSSIVSGRGCPYDCCFCEVTSQQGKRYRLRSADNVFAEMEWLYREYGVSVFSFRDPSMICSRRRLLELCEAIVESGMKIAWTCNARANEIGAEKLEAMKAAGCRLIQYGIEVGNAEMLLKIKRLTREEVAEAVTATRRAGISAHGYFIFGFLEDTRETIRETMEFSRQLDLNSAGFATMVPFPGTAEYERCRSHGLLLTDDWRDYSVSGRLVYRHRS